MTWIGIFLLLSFMWLWCEIRTAPTLDQYGNQIEEEE